MQSQEIKCGDVEWIHFAEEAVNLFHPHIGNNRCLNLGLDVF